MQAKQIRYFDHTATRLLDQKVLDFYLKSLQEDNYNPAARHWSGYNCQQKINEGLKTLASLLGCAPDQIITCSGASEAINTVIKGLAWSKGPKHKRILITAGEHPASREAALFLADYFDFELDVCPVDRTGKLDLSALEELLQGSEYDLFSCIHVNNETGAINDLAAIDRIRQKWQTEMLIHADCTQSIGKLAFNFRQTGMDFVSCSGHKFGAPKGIGFLLTKQVARLPALISGGGQQDNRRSGTENPALFLTTVYALSDICPKIDQNLAYCRELKDLLLTGLSAAGIDYISLSADDNLPQIVSLVFPQLRAETLLNCLTAKGFEISIGSACSSKKKDRDRYIQTLLKGYEANLDLHVVRVSLAETNSPEEVTDLVKEIAKNIEKFAR